VSKEMVSRITDKVMEELAEWANRPLDGVYAAIFIDAIVVKVRDGLVANRPIYATIGVSLAGENDVPGCGPEPAVRVRSSGWPSSPISATGVSGTCSSWSATASKAYPRWSRTCGRDTAAAGGRTRFG